MVYMINTNSTVSLHFSLRTDNGELIDSTFERKQPPTLTMGDGKLLPGFEKKLLGLKAGEKKTFVMLPEDGFGMPNPQNVQIFPRAQFADIELSEGLMISFADAARAELPGVIKQITTDEVAVDFNHPLAGRTLHFEVEIFKVD